MKAAAALTLPGNELVCAAAAASAGRHYSYARVCPGIPRTDGYQLNGSEAL